MSETNPPPVPPAPPQPPTHYVPPPPSQRSGCATAFMVLFGIVLLLPGLCALIFGVTMIGEAHFDSTIVPLVLLGLLVGFGGVMLLYFAATGRSRPR